VDNYCDAGGFRIGHPVKDPRTRSGRKPPRPASCLMNDGSLARYRRSSVYAIAEALGLRVCFGTDHLERTELAHPPAVRDAVEVEDVAGCDFADVADPGSVLEVGRAAEEASNISEHRCPRAIDLGGRRLVDPVHGSKHRATAGSGLRPRYSFLRQFTGCFKSSTFKREGLQHHPATNCQLCPPRCGS
jgi:hypothetical protein